MSALTKSLISTAVILLSILFSFQSCNKKEDAATNYSFSPTSGHIGTLVTVTSSDVDLSNLSSVKINGTSQLILSQSASEMKVFVMPNTTTGNISVSDGSQETTLSDTFNVSAVITPPTNQQGNKLVGSGGSGSSSQGASAALSADGNTLIVGGYGDSSSAGAAWVYTRSGGVWSQQGSKLVGTGAVGNAEQGTSVALSADGNTALIGGLSDDGSIGAAWVFNRSGGVWSQQGNKLVGAGAVGNSEQGASVSLSADGNTAVIGGYSDDSNMGAVWVFIRSGSTWTQHGSKLVGSGVSGASAKQGYSVSISADGNTMIVGGNQDDTSIGAAWVYTRSGGVWSQQGSKLVGTDALINRNLGSSVSLSADGNTAVIGGNGDNSSVGAAWVFTRSGSTWSQQGSKLVGTGASGSSSQGYGVSLSADGNTAVIGGNGDNGSVGAAWVFTRSGSAWSQQGSKLVGAGASGSSMQGYAVSLSADGNTAISGGIGDSSNAGASWVFIP